MFLLSAILCPAQSVAEVPEATVRRFYGTVEVVGKTGATYKAYANAILQPGDTLRTGKDGTAELEIAGVGGVRVDANSEVKVPEKNAEAPTQESLQMLKGKLFFNVDAEALKKQGNKEFRLKTPATLLAVKGTRFFAAISATGETAGVHQGEVAVTETVSKQIQAIRAGTAVDVAGNKLSAPRRLLPMELASVAMYSGGELFATALPLGDGKRWLIMGCVITPDGNRFYLNQKREIVIVDQSFQEKVWSKGSSANWRNLAVDQQGNLYVSVDNSAKKEGEIIQVFSDGKQKQVFATQYADLLKSADKTGKELPGNWGGKFAFGRNADGVMDMNILYLADRTKLWRVTRGSSGWSKAQQLTQDLDFRAPSGGHVPFIIEGLAVAGPSEAFVFNVNGNPRSAFCLTDWKTLEQFSQAFPYNQRPPSGQNHYSSNTILSIYDAVAPGKPVILPPK